MKVVVLYRSNSEHGTSVESYNREFKARTGRELELIDIDTRQGADMAELYGVVRYPAFLAVSDTGELQKLWMDESLPLINEVTAYVIAR